MKRDMQGQRKKSAHIDSSGLAGIRIHIGWVFLNLILLQQVNSEPTIALLWDNIDNDFESRYVPATVSIDDLLHTESISVHGILEAGQVSESTVTYQKTVLKATNGDNVTQKVVWHGRASEGSFGFATVLVSNSNSYAGKFTTIENTYSLFVDKTGNFRVRVSLWADEKQGSNDYVASNDDLQKEYLLKQLNEEEEEENDMLQIAKIVQMDRTRKYSLVSFGNRKTVTDPTNHVRRSVQQETKSNTVIDVLILITNRAMCEHASAPLGCDLDESGPIEDMMEVVEEETNQAIAYVNVPVEIRIVQMVHIAAGFDARATDGALSHMVYSNTIKKWRNYAGADLVAMITGRDPFGVFGGIAFSVWSITSHWELDYYTFSHEIGHSLGCNHNEEDDQGLLPHPYAYGYRVEGEYRTIMSYPCDSYCPRIPVFSANGLFYDGEPIGDPEHDNARMIAYSAPYLEPLRTYNPDSTPLPDRPVLPPESPLGLTCPSDDGSCRGMNKVKLDFFSLFCFDFCIFEALLFLVNILGMDCGHCDV